MKWIITGLICLLSIITAYLFILKANLKVVKEEKTMLENKLVQINKNNKIKNHIKNVRKKIHEQTRKKIKNTRTLNNSAILRNLNNEFNMLHKDSNNNEKNKTSTAAKTDLPGD